MHTHTLTGETASEVDQGVDAATHYGNTLLQHTTAHTTTPSRPQSTHTHTDRQPQTQTQTQS